MKTVNLKDGMPLVHQALSQLDREIAMARQQGHSAVKLVHGYGSSGVGGEIRIAVQNRLLEMKTRGEIGDCIFGENWAKSDEQTWKLIQKRSELKQDIDLGRQNLGITIVVL
ncbi:MAG: hypothetical protein JWO91_2737 [Acidobacteriaceae bacterium]|nr:hypothetical protein [Acidobacteriaceae bacterium]